MSSITREDRQRLIEEYARRNGGVYDPAGFMREVQEQGLNHPAHGWFNWDDAAAAESWRVEQARRFAQGLKVVFEVQQVGGGTVKIKAPAVLSPVANRKDGGGYRVTDLGDTEHINELRRQALTDLAAWEKRYSAVLCEADTQIKALRSKVMKGRFAVA